MDLKNVRQQYNQEELSEESLLENPILQLQSWMKIAIDQNLQYANAACLATVRPDGFPSTRIILIKEIKDNSVVFFTNYLSNKSSEIKNNSKVSLNIFWKEFDRQIRIQGLTSKIDLQDSKDYFYSRPRESQISAIASKQSHVITKEELHNEVDRITKLYEGKEIPFPDFWGGLKVSIEEIEFWQGRPNRLHDRFLYSKLGSDWKISRLAP